MMIPAMSIAFPDIKTLPNPEVSTETSDVYALIVYNDDVNTFDWVINCFVEVLNHDPLQAEQCAYIIHFNGKCCVKRGSYQTLAAQCDALQLRGLSSTVELR